MWWGCLAPERLVAAGLPRSLSHNPGRRSLCQTGGKSWRRRVEHEGR
jgi:hypothetical protein